MSNDTTPSGQDNEHDAALEVGDEDRLPWLEAVEDDDAGGDGPPVAKLVAAIVIGLIAIGVIVGGLFWLGNRNPAGGNGEVIAAPEGEYKIRPDNPGGMNVSGDGDVSAAASEGAQPHGNLNVSAVAEAPVTHASPAGGAPAAPAPATASGAPTQAPAATGHPAPAPATAHPAPAPTSAHPAPAGAPAAGGGATVQLGAFSSQASANQAWATLSGRFHYLAPLTHSVVATQVGGRTLYRLRASGAGAADVCRRLQVAGEACSSVN